ncbi:MAG: SusE domain-containing protein [Flavobacteriaceae bacterium]|nr:SusE domain-containing protein [Mangrovimonas sp.]MCB0431511.1 SusE domain-containing protein [Mangrovimonas sp.]MCB0435221.1 SusE domain-containing protein [Mangrovimonas sp.]MCB0437982.1 SusE domain-containing protein [Mangrovimonas sp.]MCB0469485.1 SusE domain-containing protein [Flavobacteriaceae bacterium]
MKNIKFLALLFIGLLAFNACEDDDSLTYIAEPSGEFSFTNSFLSEYTLTPGTSGNLGERFTWDNADFGVQTNVSYELQKSITGDFSDMEVIGTTDGNEYTLTIGDLLDYAAEAGLDNDPGTENPDTGSVYFRLRAYVGTDSSVEMMTSTQALTLVLPEDIGSGPVCEFDQLYGVGAGLPDAGWGWTTPNVFTCIGNGVYAANINLQNNGGADNNFRFFTSDGDWASGRNYPYYADAGYTIDANFENAMDGDSNFAFVGTTGYYYLEIDDTNKTITLDSPQSYGTCEFDQLYGVGAGLPSAGWGWTTPVILNCTGEGVYTTVVQLQNNGGADNNFRFFTSDGDWASGRNYPWYQDAGYTIDASFENAMDGDSNFAFVGTTGTYFLTIDDNNLVITLE